MKFIHLLIIWFVALTVSLYPHLMNYWLLGDYSWIADYDELGLYLPIAAKAFWNNLWQITDPLFVETHPVKYPWIQFIPFARLARAFGSDPAMIGILWRLFAAISVGTAWYFLNKRLLGSSKLSLIASLILILDTGLLEGKLIFKNFSFLWQLLENSQSLFASSPKIHTAWRIISPGLSLAGLLLFYWTVLHTRESNNKLAALVPGAALGFLFYTYFYNWTAAGLGLLFAIILDSKFRLFYFKVGLIGSLLGTYEVIKSIQIKSSTSPEWLARSDKFLPIDHFSELIVPKVAAVTLLFCLLYAYRLRKDLLFLAAQALAGLLLLNHQILTGLQIENFHWLYPSGPTLSLLMVCVTTDIILRNQKRFSSLAHFNWKPILYTALVCYIALGIGLRHWEVSRSRDSVLMGKVWNEFRKDSWSKLKDQMPLNSALLGSPFYVETLAIHLGLRPVSGYLATLSPSVDNQNWHDRRAFNAIATGISRSEFETQEREALKSHAWGPLARLENGRVLALKERMESFDRVSSNLSEFNNKFQANYLVAPAGSALGNSDQFERARIYSDSVIDLYRLTFLR